MAAPYAFVTLLTSDSYLPGALAQVAALGDLHPSPAILPEVDFQTVCLITPQTIDVSTIKVLRGAFNHVIGVEPISSDSDKELELLGRPDLKAVLTKLHVFRLVQYSKVIFLDADVLPIRPISHLFLTPHEFSAAPDVGWPDIFNSGVMVLSPGEDKFNQLSKLLKTKGSWDGGDQGILNEWRGRDWNTLSFTYNTTPTAAYTYAPAYERYGSQISAIHFIGPDKPWNSISWRAPGTSSSQDTDASDSQRAYDYTSLVDMWYSVYDRHYRTEASIPPSDFEVRRYTSAWDDPSASSGGALGLEDLRRVALEGVNAAAFFPSKTSREGDYTSMPLEGRLDLMPPREEQSLDPEHGVEPTHSRSAASPQGASDSRQRADSPHFRGAIPQILEMPGPGIYVARERSRSPSTPGRQHAYLSAETPDRMGTLPTPGPNEYPPPPHLRSLSLPGTPSPAPALHHYNMRPDQGTPLGHIFPRRPSSPPMMSWNPAIEPPPTDAPDVFSFPTDTYFPNVWDREHPEHTSDVEGCKPLTAETLFQVPPPPAIPEQLLQQGHYRGVTGSSEGNASPSPDRSKVKPLFPWENRPRHAPRRVFPGTDSPPPGMFLPARSSPLATPERQGYRTSAPVSPLVGMPTTFSYENVWDSVPSIQKYASRLVRPSPAPWPLGPAFETAGKRGSPRERDDRAEISSLDVDDENDGDDESDGENGYRDESGRWITSGSESEAETDITKRSRSGSISSIHIVKRGKKEYKGRGVQTIQPVMRSVDIQVTPATIAREKESPRYMHPEGDSPGKQFWTSAGSYAIQEAAFGGPPMPPTDAGLHEDPNGARSPRDFSYSGQHSPIQSPDQDMTPPSKPTIPPIPSLIQRFGDENETSPGASPISSAGPLSPIDIRYPIGLPQRKGGRVWDPARGVDVIKRTSEEVLARFLRGPEAIAQR